MDARDLLREARFPDAGSRADVAVSGGSDSIGLLLLALAQGLHVTVHHVDHHARPSSGEDAEFVRALCISLGVNCVVHDVVVRPGTNFEARARAARRSQLPVTALTGHTMDDLAETVLLNLLRGAGASGLSAMVESPTKPILRLRRRDVAGLVRAAHITARHDESNDDLTFRRNHVRHVVLPVLNESAGRDVVPLLSRSAHHLAADHQWLQEIISPDLERSLGDVDCRELRTWPESRLSYWLREHLRTTDEGTDSYPPSSDEIDRAVRVVRGEVVACELSRGRRLARSGQRLSLSEPLHYAGQT